MMIFAFPFFLTILTIHPSLQQKWCPSAPLEAAIVCVKAKAASTWVRIPRKVDVPSSKKSGGSRWVFQYVLVNSNILMHTNNWKKGHRTYSWGVMSKEFPARCAFAFLCLKFLLVGNAMILRVSCDTELDCHQQCVSQWVSSSSGHRKIHLKQP